MRILVHKETSILQHAVGRRQCLLDVYDDGSEERLSEAI